MTGTRSLPVIHGIESIRLDDRIPEDDIWQFLVRSVRPSRFFRLMGAEMQGMTDSKAGHPSFRLSLSLQVTVCRGISEVHREKASCNNLFVMLAMVGARMDLEVKANSAYTSGSIQGPQRCPWNPLPWTC